MVNGIFVVTHQSEHSWYLPAIPYTVFLTQMPVAFSSPRACGFIIVLCFLSGIKEEALVALRQEILYFYSSKDFMLFDLNNTLTPATNRPGGTFQMITGEKAWVSLGYFWIVKQTWERKEAWEKMAVALSLWKAMIFFIRLNFTSHSGRKFW